MSEADVEAINQLREEAIAAANTGDLARMMNLWLDNAVRLAPDEPAAIGKAAVDAQFRAMFNDITLELSALLQSVEVGGDWAWSWWTYVGAFIPKAGGEAIRETGKCVDILRKQPDGVWKWALHIWNSDAPLK
ncbi:MAG: nuclear transport factor 2 family protein [Acidobacteriia bacterium]|nr:nuclear transport factor 2 family protein [Terriglobia bacterium]